MGFFKENPEKQEQQRIRDERTKAFAKFQGMIEQLHPEWTLTFGDSVALTATCPYGQETLTLKIEWFAGSITDDGDLNPGSPGCEKVSFSVQSPSVGMFLIMQYWGRINHAYAWNQAAFDWLLEYGRNSAPLIALRERRLNLKRSLGF